MRKLLLIAFLGLAACATTANYEKNLNALVGTTEGNLVETWGIPDGSYSPDPATKYLVYNRSHDSYVAGTPPTYQTTCRFGICTTHAVGGTEGFSTHEQCKTTFRIVDGKVESWKWQGNACKA
jgi:hypothetical protein